MQRLFDAKTHGSYPGASYTCTRTCTSLTPSRSVPEDPRHWGSWNLRAGRHPDKTTSSSLPNKAGHLSGRRHRSSASAWVPQERRAPFFPGWRAKQCYLRGQTGSLILLSKMISGSMTNQMNSSFPISKMEKSSCRITLRVKQNNGYKSLPGT